MVLHLKRDLAVAGRRRAQPDLLAMMRELDRIADQVCQRLQRAIDVHHHVHRLGIDAEGDIAVRCGRLLQVRSAAQQIYRIGLLTVQRQTA
jgi:hypothetical protein